MLMCPRLVMLVLRFVDNLLGRKALGSLWTYMSDVTDCCCRVDVNVDSMMVLVKVITGLK